jgi:hypothetical protein
MMTRRSLIKKLLGLWAVGSAIDIARAGTMAKEIRLTSTLRYSKDQAAASLATAFSADQTGSKYESGVQAVGTAEETLAKNDVGTIGYLALRNNDTTNYVEFGAVATEYSIKLGPGEGCVVPWKRTAVYAKANTASCDVEYLMIEL